MAGRFNEHPARRLDFYGQCSSFRVFFFLFFCNSLRQISWKNRLLRVVISCFDRCGFVFSRFVVFCFLFFSCMQFFGVGVAANEMEILCNYRKNY